MNELICLDIECGPDMVERIDRAWAEDDAVFPLDQRLPPAMKRSIVEAVAPTAIVTANDETKWPGRAVNDGEAAVIATSGSTGEPRFIPLTMDNLRASTWASHQRLGLRPDDHWLCCLPPSHVGGFGVIARSLLSGTSLTAVPRFDPDLYERAAQDGATLVSLVPAALARIDPSRYRTILLGGSRPPVDLPDNCVTTYGMTETGGGIAYDGVPLDGVELEIRDGIIHVRSPMNAGQTREGIGLLDHDGWLRTGDVGSFDPATGGLVVVGREGDMIITGGENVWPEQVERVLREHDSILDACVVGEPDDHWGHIVVAHLVTKGSRTPGLAEIRAHVKSMLPAHCAPKAIRLIQEIPRTSIGKPRRHLLRGAAADPTPS